MKYEKEIRELIASTDWFTRALRDVQSLGLQSWCIGAGALRNLIWDARHGYPPLTNQSDIDVAYFNDGELRACADEALQARLEALDPSHKWEVTNQAGVHLWFETYFGHPVRPLRSLQDAVSTWPEFCTSVGVTLLHGEMEIIAPYGLDDLFELRVKRNPARVSLETFRSRVASKDYVTRWPSAQVIHE